MGKIDSYALNILLLIVLLSTLIIQVLAQGATLTLSHFVGHVYNSGLRDEPVPTTPEGTYSVSKEPNG